MQMMSRGYLGKSIHHLLPELDLVSMQETGHPLYSSKPPVRPSLKRNHCVSRVVEMAEEVSTEAVATSGLLLLATLGIPVGPATTFVPPELG